MWRGPMTIALTDGMVTYSTPDVASVSFCKRCKCNNKSSRVAKNVGETQMDLVITFTSEDLVAWVAVALMLLVAVFLVGKSLDSAQGYIKGLAESKSAQIREKNIWEVGR